MMAWPHASYDAPSEMFLTRHISSPALVSLTFVKKSLEDTGEKYVTTESVMNVDYCFGLCPRAVLYMKTNVSEEHATGIFRVGGCRVRVNRSWSSPAWSFLLTALRVMQIFWGHAIAKKWSLLHTMEPLNWTLQMEGLWSYKKSVVVYQTTRRHIAMFIVIIVRTSNPASLSLLKRMNKQMRSGNACAENVAKNEGGGWTPQCRARIISAIFWCLFKNWNQWKSAISIVSNVCTTVCEVHGEVLT